MNQSACNLIALAALANCGIAFGQVTISEVPPLPTGFLTTASGVSGDGLIAFGYSNIDEYEFAYEAIRWGLESGTIDLGVTDPTSGASYFATGASFDGSAIVGWFTIANDA